MKISVLMSIHNDQAFLEQSLNSIIDQSYEDFECIIIDDASTDDSPKILKQFADQDSRIKIITNNENQGLGKSLNIALNNAKGEYIARMDGDDICLPSRFAKQAKFLDENPDITVVGTWIDVIDENENRKPDSTRKYATEHKDIVKQLWANPMLHPTVMMRSKNLKELGGYPELRRRQDYALWFKAYKQGWKFSNIAESLLLYRVTSAHLEKNSLKDSYLQMKIGISGYFNMGGKNPLIYMALTYPFIRSMIPVQLRNVIDKTIKKLDPRNNRKSSR